ncbi:MAG: 5-(carboxyamino)imidazole ribonucleotide synthase [Pseudomonadota bacterium]|nr:5-(carboxyamino)imidazole ribonucleotide synthase [Pseudomonadota bacterium]
MKIGILGGGQLAQMLALAGFPLGQRCVALDPKADAPAGQLVPLIVADYDDRAALDQLAAQVDVVTFDFENVPVESARYLSTRLPCFPPHLALEKSQDRLAEKSLFTDLDIPTAPYFPVDTREDLTEGVAALGLPALLKTRRFGYDGKGQFLLREAADLDRAWTELGGQALLLEGFVQFERELSIIAVRGRDGQTAFYPLSENQHSGGILRVSRAPYRAPELETQAQSYMDRLLNVLDYVGVLALECFVCKDGLLANEFAPRVHNSGHWTIEGARTSQFENHLRAIAGLPLGDPSARGDSVMFNCIGKEPPLAQVAAVPGAHIHRYGKAARPGRKLGHITLTGQDPAELREREAQLAALIPTDSADPSAIS